MLSNLINVPLILSPRPVLIVRMLLQMNSSQPFGLIDIGPLVVVTEKLPLGTETLANLRIVHLRVLLGHLAPPIARPHHERVHGPLNSLQIDYQPTRVTETTASAADDATADANA